MESQKNKTLAILICLFLLYMYKESVLDPYVNKTPVGVGPVTSQSAPGGAPERAPGISTPDQWFPPVDHPENGEAQNVDPASSDHHLADVDSGGNNRLAGELRVLTDALDIRLDLLGGRISSAKLIGYKKSLDDEQDYFDLVKLTDPELQSPNLGVTIDDGITDAKVAYHISKSTFAPKKLSDQVSQVSLGKGQDYAVVLSGSLADGRDITKTLHFAGTSHFIEVQVVVEEQDGNTPTISVDWGEALGLSDKLVTDSTSGAGFTWYNGEKAEREFFSSLKLGHNEADRAQQNGELNKSISKTIANVKWLTLGSKYFMATLISEPIAGSSDLLTTAQTLARRISYDDPDTKDIEGANYYAFRMSAKSPEVNYKLFLGPKSYFDLQKLGYKLHLNVDLGWTGSIAVFLLAFLHFIYGIFGNYGLSIVVLTIVIKLLLYPLNTLSLKQGKAMQELAPEIKRIRETIKDRAQQQQMQMELYKKRGVNPFGGCLPMFAQIPIFFGLFTALRLDIELRHAPFAFWIKDLSSPDRLPVLGVGIPVLVILMVATMIVQQMLTPAAVDPQQKKMMMFMTLFFGFLFINFPAGLTIYYLTSSIVSVAQSKAMRSSQDSRLSPLQITLMTSFILFMIAFVMAHVGN